MIRLNNEDKLAIVITSVYTPFFFTCIRLCFRVDWKRGTGFLLLAIFCMVRVIDSGQELSTISDPSHGTLYGDTSRTSVTGIAPLLLATLDFVAYLSINLDDIPDSQKRAISIAFIRKVRTLSLGSLAGAFMAIATGIQVATMVTPPSYNHANDWNMAVVALFLFSWLCISLLALIAWLRFRIDRCSEHDVGVRRFLSALALAIPLLLLRLLYSVIGTFLPARNDNSLTAGQTSFVCMALLSEFGVVLGFVVVGFWVPALPVWCQEFHDEESLDEEDSSSESEGGTPSPRLSRRERSAALSRSSSV